MNNALIDVLRPDIEKGPLQCKPWRVSSFLSIVLQVDRNTRSTVHSPSWEMIFLAVDDRPMFLV